MWARYVTLPNQERIWTLTVTNKSAPKPKQQGVIFLLYKHYTQMSSTSAYLPAFISY